MKKVISVFSIVIMLFAFSACSNFADRGEVTSIENAEFQTTMEKSETEGETIASSGKILIAYFSQAGEQYKVGVVEKGNTEILAEAIAEETGGTLFHIEKEEEYPDTYDELTDIAKAEQNENARPKLKGSVENFDQYDTIYLGYPIWWGDLPMPVYTFLENYDFSGKTVIPFCTHEGSGNAGTQATLEKLLPDSTVKDILAVNGSDAQELSNSTLDELKAWINEK